MTKETDSRIRVLCVDDHRIVREGIELVIAREPDMVVVGSVTTGEEAIAFYRSNPPDVTLMDLQLRTMSGTDAIRAIRSEHRDARIIVLTMYEGDEHIARAMKAGASTYLLKDTLSKDLIRVIRTVFRGVQLVPDRIVQSLKENAEHRPLSPREVQVMELIIEGRRNKEIADLLNISEETVPVHLRNIFAKLGVNDRAAAMLTAIRRGIVQIRQS